MGNRFEFDQNKSDSNKVDHEIDFVEAQKIWDDSESVTGPGQTTGGEIRWVTVGKIDGKLWAAVWTDRNGAIRIISVRPARPEERDAYGE